VQVPVPPKDKTPTTPVVFVPKTGTDGTKKVPVFLQKKPERSPKAFMPGPKPGTFREVQPKAREGPPPPPTTQRINIVVPMGPLQSDNMGKFTPLSVIPSLDQFQCAQAPPPSSRGIGGTPPSGGGDDVTITSTSGLDALKPPPAKAASSGDDVALTDTNGQLAPPPPKPSSSDGDDVSISTIIPTPTSSSPSWPSPQDSYGGDDVSFSDVQGGAPPTAQTPPPAARRRSAGDAGIPDPVLPSIDDPYVLFAHDGGLHGQLGCCGGAANPPCSQAPAPDMRCTLC
jgi:hypothetical protein